MDGDRAGDVCDNDVDGDYVRNSRRQLPDDYQPAGLRRTGQPDADGDGIGERVRRPTAAGPAVVDAGADRPRRRRASTERPPGAARDAALASALAPRRDRGRPGRARDVLGGVRGQGRADGGPQTAKRLKLRPHGARGRGHARSSTAPRTTYAFVRFERPHAARAAQGKRTTLTLKVAATDPRATPPPRGARRRGSRASCASGDARGCAERASARSCRPRRWRRPPGGR